MRKLILIAMVAATPAAGQTFESQHALAMRALNTCQNGWIRSRREAAAQQIEDIGYWMSAHLSPMSPNGRAQSNMLAEVTDALNECRSSLYGA